MIGCRVPSPLRVTKLTELLTTVVVDELMLVVEDVLLVVLFVVVLLVVVVAPVPTGAGLELSGKLMVSPSSAQPEKRRDARTTGPKAGKRRNMIHTLVLEKKKGRLRT